MGAGGVTIVPTVIIIYVRGTLFMKKLLVSAAIAALIPSVAMAQDSGFKKSAGDVLLRARAIAVIPSE